MTRFPLSWPSGWRRNLNRRSGKFNTKTRTEHQWLRSRNLTISEAVQRVRKELEMMGISDDDSLISSNVPVRLDGLPRSDKTNYTDPGVAVYWKKPEWATHKVMAIDQYLSVADNLAAVAATLEAMRAIERHGGALILERAFVGFDALPAPKGWREVMGFNGVTPTREEVQQRYRVLARSYHPDQGGSEGLFQELSRAYEDAKRELQV